MEKRTTATKTVRVRGRSSTQDILGGVGLSNKVQRRWEEHHRRLNVLRDEISGNKNRQAFCAKEEQQSFGEHMADAATDSYDRDCALALLSSAQNALYEIEQALRRIANGTYGTCELTGKAIESERLKAIPWTRYSAGAQNQLEARGYGDRVQLGELGSCLHSGGRDDTVEDFEDLVESQAEREAA
jgi:RNA polymerase-binding transcription factor DksA